MKFLLLILLFGLNNAFRLPRIFQNGMVLQANPTDAVIWGFLDGNTNPVDISAECTINGEKFAFVKRYIPKEVPTSHREFCFRNGRGKTCLWKKHMLVYFDSQNPGKKKNSLPTLSF